MRLTLAALLLGGCATARDLPDWVTRGTGLVSYADGWRLQAVVEAPADADTAECLLGEVLELFATRFAELATSTGLVPTADAEAFRATYRARLGRRRPTIAAHRQGETGYTVAGLDFEAALDALPARTRPLELLVHALATRVEAEECHAVHRTKCGDVQGFCPVDANP